MAVDIVPALMELAGTKRALSLLGREYLERLSVSSGGTVHLEPEVC